jgi:hypothetical protein
MKRKVLYAGILLIALLAVDLIRSAPDSRWKSIQVGMTEEEVRTKLDKPTSDQAKAKSVQVWINDGFIRSTSLAVLYYDPEHPTVVTRTHEWTRWIWERL